MTPARSTDALAVIVTDVSIRGDTRVIGSGATAVVSGEAGLAPALSALADAAFFTSAELPFVPIATEVLTLAKRTAHYLFLELVTR